MLEEIELSERDWIRKEVELMLVIEATLKIREWCNKMEDAARDLADFYENETLTDHSYGDPDLPEQERDEARSEGERVWNETWGMFWQIYGLGDSRPPGLMFSPCGNERSVAEAAQSLIDALNEGSHAGCLSPLEERDNATKLWEQFLEPSRSAENAGVY